MVDPNTLAIEREPLISIRSVSRDKFWIICMASGGTCIGINLGLWYPAWKSGAISELFNVAAISSLAVVALSVQMATLGTVAVRVLRPDIAILAWNGLIFSTWGTLFVMLFGWTYPELLSNPAYASYLQDVLGISELRFDWSIPAGILLVGGIGFWTIVVVHMKGIAGANCTSAEMSGLSA